MARTETLQTSFIMTGSEDWYSASQTCKHHIAKQLVARGARVLYIQNISMRSLGSEGSRDLAKVLRRLGAFFRGLDNPQPNLYCFSPIYLPFPRFRFVRWLNSIILPLMIRFHAWRIGLRRPVFIYFMPTGYTLQGRLGESLSVYYIVDNYTAFSGIERETMQQLEQSALATAGAVFATARLLADDRRRARPDINFMPHGVDFDHFAKAQDPATPVPPEMDALPRPRIGFMGAVLADSIDTALMKDLVCRRRDWHFVVFGRALTDISSLLEQPNFTFLGPKPYADMPGLLKGCDVAWIPFLENDLTRDLNPIKLREYLAAGVPIVATDVPCVREYQQWVKCVRTLDEFEQAIEESLRDPGDPRERQQAVAQESWSSRADEIVQIITQALERKRS